MMPAHQKLLEEELERWSRKKYKKKDRKVYVMLLRVLLNRYFATDLSGNDGFMSACIFGRTNNAKFWLDRFPDWDLERKNKVAGGCE